ncbi:MAG: hypothetical protein AAGG01_17460 [Planctomycetota bacterium]
MSPKFKRNVLWGSFASSLLILVWTIGGMVTQSQAGPRSVPVERYTDAGSSPWVSIAGGELSMRDLVVDTRVSSSEATSSAEAYLVPYVPRDGVAREGPLALIRFDAERFEERFPAVHARLNGDHPDRDESDVASARTAGPVRGMELSDRALPPLVRKFVGDRWGTVGSDVVIIDADARPESRRRSLALAWGALILAALFGAQILRGGLAGR